MEQHDNTLLLSGCVSRFYYKQLAQEVVRSVSADITVISSIRVDPEEDLRWREGLRFSPALRRQSG